MGGLIAALVAGYLILIVGGIPLMVRMGELLGRSWRDRAWVISFCAVLLGIALCVWVGVVLIVNGHWNLDREKCIRAAQNLEMRPRWDRLVGCYVRDDSGRFVPLDQYLTVVKESR